MTQHLSTEDLMSGSTVTQPRLTNETTVKVAKWLRERFGVTSGIPWEEESPAIWSWTSRETKTKSKHHMNLPLLRQKVQVCSETQVCLHRRCRRGGQSTYRVKLSLENCKIHQVFETSKNAMQRCKFVRVWYVWKHSVQYLQTPCICKT